MHNLVVGSTVKSYPGQRKAGYRLVSEENLPMKVSEDAKKNVIRVYYEKIGSGLMIVDAEIPLGAGTASLNAGECVE